MVLINQSHGYSDDHVNLALFYGIYYHLSQLSTDPYSRQSSKRKRRRDTFADGRVGCMGPNRGDAFPIIYK